jgi:hypothetical protein
MNEKPQAQFDREIRAAEARLADARRELGEIPGVVGVQVGIKARDGLATEDVVFLVYVERKKRLGDLPPEERVPKELAGLPTDVVGLADTVPEDVYGGGIRLTQTLWGASYGTLGAVGIATAANAHVPDGTPLMLTNQHVAEDVGELVGHKCLCDCCCCECCDMGRVVDNALTQDVDGAIAEFHPGVRFSHDIIGIGAIRGAMAASAGGAVLKMGQTTGLTRGRIMAINEPPFTRTDGNTFRNQIRVAPIAPSTDMSEGGDSGSVYVDEDTRRIVGLHHAGRGSQALGSHMTSVAGPTATTVMGSLNIEFRQSGTVGSIPLAGAAIVDPGPTMLDALVELQATLEQTESGRRWIELIHRHGPEVQHLVNHNRAATVAWQHCRGPAFVGHYARWARQARQTPPGEPHHVPREIDGMRVRNVIVSMAAVLQREGSPELRDAISEHYLTAMELVAADDAPEAVIERARRRVRDRLPAGARS